MNTETPNFWVFITLLIIIYTALGIGAIYLMNKYARHQSNIWFIILGSMAVAFFSPVILAYLITRHRISQRKRV